MQRRAWWLGWLVLVLGCREPSADVDDASSVGSESGAGETDESESETDETGDPPPDLPSGEPSDCERLEQLVAALADEPSAELRAQQIAAFVREVGYGDHGFPIVEAGKLAVVHVGEPGSALALAGDFDGWQPVDLVEPAPGFF